MRILRSQYMQLQNNVNESKSTTTHVASFKQQVQRRPSIAYNTNDASHNLRRKSKVSYYTYNSGQRSDHNDPIPITFKPTMARRSTITKSNTVIRRRSLSVISLDSESSSPSSSSSSATNCSSGYETLQQNTSYRTNLKNANALMLKPTEQQTLERTSGGQKRTLSNAMIGNKTVTAFDKYTTTKTSEQMHHMHIKFSNVPETVGNINVSVEFVDMGPQWLTKIYQSYENDLWSKTARTPPTRSCKWLFKCTFCQKQLCKFSTLIIHLNRHLELYPYICKFCARPYAGRPTLLRHLKSVHGIQKEFGLYIGV